MTLRVVGAGVCRTGTLSLKTALERLLGAPCHHMAEVFEHPDQVPQWQLLADGGTPDWDGLFDGYAAAVDFPASLAWRELAGRYPDAPVLLSTRTGPEVWWRSASATVFAVRDAPPGDVATAAHRRMIGELIRNRFCADESPEALQAAYVEHNAAVRAAVDPARLVEWQPGDGWEPLCRMLGVPVPDEPFPNVNSTAEFRERAGLDRAERGSTPNA